MTGLLGGALAVLAIVAVVSPSLGSVFDHHVVERMADHEHAYYGRPDLRHKHGYETPHADPHRLDTPTASASHTVVILPSNSAAREGSVIAATVGFTIERATPPLSAPRASLLPSTPDRRPGPIFLPPPYTPPRTGA